eukprot:TRINITY_DN1277_c0_g1_i2.p1 TRINITY_DN1277_c0_g1~~TRINITY_DN1277_c0_g1_i2.p1  ORF type:complete len:289 (-),score=11.55 TRINITY_DN1277_c0_g1_i2:170-1036(-)
MKVAFSIWNKRIAPVFDTSIEIMLVEVENREIISRQGCSLSTGVVADKILRLGELEVGVLVCGAVSRIVQEQLIQSGIEVVPFISGEVDTVIKGWLQEELSQDSFAMPGCCGRRQRRSGCGPRRCQDQTGSLRPGRGRKVRFRGESQSIVNSIAQLIQQYYVIQFRRYIMSSKEINNKEQQSNNEADIDREASLEEKIADLQTKFPFCNGPKLGKVWGGAGQGLGQTSGAGKGMGKKCVELGRSFNQSVGGRGFGKNGSRGLCKGSAEGRGLGAGSGKCRGSKPKAKQ